MAAKHWLPIGTTVQVRKLGTPVVVEHKITKPLEIPTDAAALDATRRKFRVDGWEIVAAVQYAVRSTSRKDRGTECPRCAGRGHIAAFQHVQGGVCFKCGGTGDTSIKPVV